MKAWIVGIMGRNLGKVVFVKSLGKTASEPRRKLGKVAFVALMITLFSFEC